MASLFRRKDVVICTAMVLAAACGLSQPRLPVDRSQDERILGEVAARIAAEPSLDSQSIRVDVEGGTVMLHGSVRGMGAWQCAITNAGLVRGVRTVVDYLVLERGERNVQCLAPRPDTSVIVGDP
jgi:osmotically-inducible protein OsmY